MFKLEFDPANRPLAAAIGAALVSYGTGAEFTAELSETVVDTGKPLAAAIAEGDIEETGNVAEGDIEETGNVAETAASDITVQDTKQTAGSSASTAPAGNDASKLDEKGVGFNAAYCGKASIPFYASGKTKGQWKKRQGIAQSTYDSWYEDSLASASTGATTGQADEQINTSAAFGRENDAAPTDLTFGNAGEFMAWMSEQQTANRLTQGDIDSAYNMTQIQVHDLFNPELFPNAVAAIYGYLKPIAAAA